MFNISKLPAPSLIVEYSLSEKIEMLKSSLRESLPEWTGSDADPVMKVLKAVAAFDCLREQRINETARRMLLAYAKGSDLDNIRPEFPRLQGENATCVIEVKADGAGVVPEGFEVTDTTGSVVAKTMQTLEFAGAGTLSVSAEITVPSGLAGNGISGKLTEQRVSNPIVASVSQVEEGSGGSDDENDERYVERILLAPDSNKGGWRSYAFHVLSADGRIKHYKILSPEPAHVDVVLLSSEADGTADAAMIDRVEKALSPEKVVPQSDVVNVVSAGIIEYELSVAVFLYPGVEQSVVNQVLERAQLAVSELHRCGYDITKSILNGKLHVEGVSKLVFSAGAAEWEDVDVDSYHAAFCTGLSVAFGGFFE